MTKEDKTMGNNGRTYRGVTVPESILRTGWTGTAEDTPYTIGWKDGVDAAWTAGVRNEPDTGQDTNTPGDRTVSPEVSAFQAVTEDRTDEARRIVSRLSGRDRAVLSFWLAELSSIVDNEESIRRLSF